MRDFYDGLVLLHGGMSDGVALRAAVTLGADLSYMGTRFIAAAESTASDAYRSVLIGSDIDDVRLTRAFTGLPANFLRPAIAAPAWTPATWMKRSPPKSRTPSTAAVTRLPGRNGGRSCSAPATLSRR